MFVMTLPQVRPGGVPTLLGHDPAADHRHPTAKRIVAGDRRNEFDGRGLERRKGFVDLQGLKYHSLRALRGLVAVEVEPDWPAGLHQNGVGLVTTLHQHPDLLRSTPTGGTRRGSRTPGPEEEPQLPTNQ